LNAKRIEWHRGLTQQNHNAVNAWGPITDVASSDIVCMRAYYSRIDIVLIAPKGGRGASPPELHAVARAGADVAIQWSGMIKMHNGPVMSVGLEKSDYMQTTKALT
jgi:hypothetical protein